MKLLNKKVFIVLAIVIIILILSTIRIDFKLTHKTLESSINKPMAIEEFKPQEDSFYFLLVPEDSKNNSLLINLAYTRWGGDKPVQTIDLGGYYDQIVQDKKDFYKNSIIDTNNLSKPLSFICETKRNEGNMLYFDNDIQYDNEDIEKSNVVARGYYDQEVEDLFGIGEDVKYIMQDLVRGSEGEEAFIGYHLNFEPVFMIDGAKYSIKDVAFPYCYARETSVLQ